MKRQSKKYLSIIMTLSIICSCITVFAAPKFKPIRAYLAPSFKYSINGKMVLDKIPTIVYKDNVYVPVEDIMKALGHQVEVKDGTVTITTGTTSCPSQTPIPRPTPAPTPIPRPTPQPTPIPRPTPVGENVVIPKADIVAIDFNGKTVTVLPAGKDNKLENQIILNVTPNTVITDGKTKKVYTLNDLNTNMSVKVVHSNIMTKSIPPQTQALEITILSGAPSMIQPR